MKATWPRGSLRIPLILWRVVWGLSETIDIFSPTSALRSVDFPEFGRPIKAAEPDFTFASLSPRLRGLIPGGQECLDCVEDAVANDSLGQVRE